MKEVKFPSKTDVALSFVVAIAALIMVMAAKITIEAIVDYRAEHTARIISVDK